MMLGRGPSDLAALMTATAIISVAPCARAQQTDSAPLEATSSAGFAEALELVPADLRDSFSAALSDLSAADWQLRERAESWIEDSGVPDAVIEAILESSTLAPEQAHRLVGALRDRILKQERGAIGIEMTTGTSPVRVVEVRPNMPAKGRLQVGDTIVAIDGIAILTSIDLEGVLRDCRPGQQIEVTVRRGEDGNGAELPDEEATVTVPITLTDDSLFSEEERVIRRQARVARARELVLRHAPRPQPPRLSGGESSTSGEAIEIDTLRRQITLYQSTNDATIRRMLEEEWRDMREALLVATLAPGISDEERQRRWDLYNAYLELVPTDGQ